MYNSYKDALLIGKAVEQPINQVSTKKNSKIYSISQIKKMCILGKDQELKLVNKSYFTSDNIIILTDLMKEKIIEIENWKYEDKNQIDNLIHELNERINGISRCLDYIKLII